ncbi:CvpA family protein, partial [Acinetobacter baumannii]
KKSTLSGTDRIVGCLFGLLRGVLVVSLAVMFAQFTPLIKQPAWSNSILLPRFEVAARWMMAQLPALGFEQIQKVSAASAEPA